MISSEKMDFGKVSGGRSNFSQTCSILSQYLKENGRIGDLSLSLTPNFTETKGTTNLLPKIEQPDQKGAMFPQLAVRGEDIPDFGGKSEKETAQMTIFYAGQVIVFNDFPADKAKEIMISASKCIPHSAAFAPPHTAHNIVEPATTTPIIIPTSIPLPALGSDLPIARKISLARFLEKRKDRITANAPYQASKPVPKPVNTMPWLELGSQFPLQIERH